ncbi:MAG: DUF6206 family protein [Candidatus Promineifilaceae bacterium]|jgi:hypothetical protein
MLRDKTNTIEYDHDFLAQFEAGIDPLDPQRSKIPAQVLGYGEMSTVMTIDGANPNLVYKRMPMFQNTAELEQYLAVYDSCLDYMTAAGINVVPAAITAITPQSGNIVVYIIQEKLDGRALINQAIHTLQAADVARLFAAILANIGRVFAYNDAQQDGIELGLDAQMSNWAIANFDPGQGQLADSVELIYIDTSSPLLKVHGQHQLDPELFLRSAPSFLRPVIRLLFVDDVMNRYYVRRQIVIDVIGNLYKEKREDVIPDLIEMANDFLEPAATSAGFQPVTAEEVAGYYREDARIWSIYLSSRRLDRSLHRLLGKPYPYVLPGHIDR